MKKTFVFSVQYFKPSGKFYTETTVDFETGFTQTAGGDIPNIFEAVEQFKVKYYLSPAPGLSCPASLYHVLIFHPNGYPCLIPLSHCSSVDQ